MPSDISYTIFETCWGYFGLAADGKGILRTQLPCSSATTAEKHILSGLGEARYDEALLRPVREQIIGYFNADSVDFSDAAVNLNGVRVFTQQILNACRRVAYGRTATYGQLAKMVESAKAARAVGGAMSRNPVPLIIPCHRILRTDGGLGGFSGMGGVKMKHRMLEMEASQAR
jgi:methylated-DNA-[protein]-cysteine S-methyltransferase